MINTSTKSQVLCEIKNVFIIISSSTSILFYFLNKTCLIPFLTTTELY